jgi:hypothetical protein
MEVTAFVGAIGYLIKEADMSLMALRTFYLCLLTGKDWLQV